MPHICLSFAGVAGNFPFQIGAAQGLLELVEDEPAAYAGLSSGSVIATMLALGYKPPQMLEEVKRFPNYFNAWYKTPVTWWLTATRCMFRAVMSDPDTYKQLCGRLYIGYSVLTATGIQAREVSEFTSNEDVIDAIITSCYLFPYSHWPCRFYRGELACDGAYARGLIKPDGYQVMGLTTSMVHANCFYSDWIPSLCYNKTQRLYDAGHSFVRRHHDYFTAARDGTSTTLPGYPNPLKRIRWMIYGMFVLVGWWCLRRRGGWKILLERWKNGGAQLQNALQV